MVNLAICAIYQELLCAAKQWQKEQGCNSLHGNRQVGAALGSKTGEISVLKQTITTFFVKHNRFCLFSFPCPYVSPPGICISLGRRGPPSEFSIPKARSHCDGAPRFIIDILYIYLYLTLIKV